MYNCSPSCHHPCTGSITHTYILNVCIYIHMYTYNCLPHVLNMHLCCRTCVGPKGPRSMRLLPAGLHLVGFVDAEGLWRCNDHLSRSVNAYCRVNTHTYVRTYVHTHVLDHSLQLRMYVYTYVYMYVYTYVYMYVYTYVYMYVYMCAHKVQYLCAYTCNYLYLPF